MPAAVESLETRVLPAAGALDPTFDADGVVRSGLDGYDGGSSVAVDRQGRVIVAGTVEVAGGHSDFVVARYRKSGALDTSFGDGGFRTIDFGGGDAAVRVEVDGRGRIVVAGYTAARRPLLAVARLNAAGGLSRGFGEDGRAVLKAGRIGGLGLDLAIDSRDRVIVTGTAIGPAATRVLVARFGRDGVLDDGFSRDGVRNERFGGRGGLGIGVEVDSRDRVVVGAVVFGGRPSFAVARLTEDGRPDPEFGTDGRGRTRIDADAVPGGTTGVAFGDLALDGRNRIALVGTVASDCGCEGDMFVALLDRGGTLLRSRTIDFGGDDAATGVAFDGRGRIVVAGATDAAGDYDFAAARLASSRRLSPDAAFGTRGKVTFDAVDPAAGSGLDDFAADAAVDADGNVLLVGTTQTPATDPDASPYDYVLARLLG